MSKNRIKNLEKKKERFEKRMNGNRIKRLENKKIKIIRDSGSQPDNNEPSPGTDCSATRPIYGSNGQIVGAEPLYPCAQPMCAQDTNCIYVSSRYPNGCPRTMDCGVITNGVCGPRPIDNSLPQGVDCNATEPSAWGPNGEVTGVRLLYPVAIPDCAPGSDCTYIYQRYPNGCPKVYGCGVSANGDCGSGGLTQNQQKRIVGIDDKVSKLRDKFTKKIEQINKNIDKYKI